MIEAQHEQYIKFLRSNEKLIDRLGERKGWPRTTLCDDTLGVGWDPQAKRLVFPVYADEGGRLAGFRRYVPGGRPKMIGDRGVPLQPYPPPETLPSAEELWIFEGEPDVLSAHAMGVWPACGLPGTQSWKSEWAERFRPYGHIVICLDCDDPGRKAAWQLGADLRDVVDHVEVKDLAPGRDDGYDLSEYLLDARAA